MKYKIILRLIIRLLFVSLSWLMGSLFLFILFNGVNNGGSLEIHGVLTGSGYYIITICSIISSIVDSLFKKSIKLLLKDIFTTITALIIAYLFSFLFINSGNVVIITLIIVSLSINIIKAVLSKYPLFPFLICGITTIVILHISDFIIWVLLKNLLFIFFDIYNRIMNNLQFLIMFDYIYFPYLIIYLSITWLGINITEAIVNKESL